MVQTQKPMAAHSSAVMLYVPIMGVLYFIVVDYVHRIKTQGKVQTKFAAGKGEFGEDPNQTLNRETGEEVLETPANVSGFVQFQYVLEVPEDNGPGTYRKYFMLVPALECPGKLRREEMTEKGGTELGVPYLMTAEDLMDEIYHTHRKALAAAILFLVDKHQQDFGVSPDNIKLARTLVQR